MIVFSHSIWNLSRQLIYIFHSNTLEYETLPADIDETLKAYPALKSLVAKGNIPIPIEDDMIPQGIEIIDDEYIFITAYNYKKKAYSKCYVLNQNGDLVNTVTLDTSSHVGSIAYDEENDLLWIPDDEGSLGAYKKSEFLGQDRVFSQVKFEKIGKKLKDSKEKLSSYVDYLTIDKSNLYIGSFSKSEGGTVQEYRIKKDHNEIKLLLKSEFKVPSRIQGITFYDFGIDKYMILSRSYGRKNDSQILMYKYKEAKKEYVQEESLIKLDTPPLLEQINVGEKGLYAIFESPASKYADCQTIISNVLLIDVEKLIASHEK